MKGNMSDPKSSVDQAQYNKNTTFRGEKWKLILSDMNRRKKRKVLVGWNHWISRCSIYRLYLLTTEEITRLIK